MPYTIKPLGCDPQHIRGLSEKLIVSHYENNYGGAVKRLNAITAQLAELSYRDAPGFVINGLKREQLIAANSMVLHEVYFASLASDQSPQSGVTEALARDFGSFDKCRYEFTAMCKALAGGSGCVVLAWSPRIGRLVNQWAPDHAHAMAGATPVLALDMYEHSFHIDYGAKAAAYVDAFMQNIAWSAVGRRLAALPAASG